MTYSILQDGQQIGHGTNMVSYSIVTEMKITFENSSPLVNFFFFFINCLKKYFYILHVIYNTWLSQSEENTSQTVPKADIRISSQNPRILIAKFCHHQNSNRGHSCGGILYKHGFITQINCFCKEPLVLSASPLLLLLY